MVSRRVFDRIKDIEVTDGSQNSRIAALEGGATPPPPNSPGLVTYTIDTTTDFQNPGRGMEESFESDSGIGGGSGTLDDEGISSYSWSTFRRYWWCPTADAVLPGSFLTGVEQDIDNWVAAGKLANAKFAYFGTEPTHLSKSRIDGHINQLLPVINGRAYAFKQLELGWFGAWGETHTINSSGWTDTTPGNGSQTQLKGVYENVANNTPSTLYIGLRYPEVAMWIQNNGLSAAHLARMAIYNDDFLSTAYTDKFLEGGTFPGAWTDLYDFPRREWLADFGLTHPVRGESGVDSAGDDYYANIGDNAMYYGFQRQHIDCLRHWTNPPSLRSMVLDPLGIYDRVKRELGYRIQMRSGRFPTSGVQNTTYTFDVEFENIGFAPPRRDYVAKVKFGSTANTSAPAWVTASMFSVNLDANGIPTTTGAATNTKAWQGWQSSSIQTTRKWVRFTCTIPAGLSAGNYPISLAFIDPNTQLQSNVAFNIRLANSGTWDGTNGRNALLHTVAVT